MTVQIIHIFSSCRDPRQKRLQQKQEAAATSSNNKRDGAKLSFQEKMKLFAKEAGESTPKDRTKISKVQRDIDGNENDVSSA